MAEKGLGKGLGLGLGALFGDAADESEKKEFEYVPIARIEPRKGQPRTDFDEVGLEELAQSIREHGMIQPITVRNLSGDYYQIIAGERRWRAARIAQLDEVPVRIIEADDLTTMELAMIENLQREDLNPVEEALGYRALMKEFGLTQEELSQRVSKSRPVIANALRLLTLPEAALEMLRDGDLSTGAARALLGLKDGEQIIEAAHLVRSKGLSVRETEALVKRMSALTDKKKPPRATDIYINDVEQKLSKSLGRKITIINGKNKGKIEIEYYDSDDFEVLCGALSSIKKGGRA